MPRTARRAPRGRAAHRPGRRDDRSKLPARWVVHTVGPVWSATEDRSALLASAYRESLAVADSLGAASVAFPAISAGAYGWPAEDAARIAVSTVLANPTKVAEVRFVLFTPEVRDAFASALAECERI